MTTASPPACQRVNPRRQPATLPSSYTTTRDTTDIPTSSAFERGSFPFYAKCVETVVELHERVPFVSCIGWDVCVDSNNEPQIFEWNGRHNAIGFGEAVQGPCFRDLGWEKLWRRTEGTPAARSA